MASVMRLVAALGGIAVAFVIVMLVQALSPTPGLHDGSGVATFERFTFDRERLAFTAGSEVTLRNDGVVPATFVIEAPGGSVERVTLEPGTAANLTLTDEGTHEVRAEEWPWATQSWRVRDDNAFVRFFEDLF